MDQPETKPDDKAPFHVEPEPLHHLKRALRKCATQIADGERPRFLFVESTSGTWVFHPHNLSVKELTGIAGHILAIAKNAANEEPPAEAGT